MMNFRIIRDAVRAVLAQQSGGEYTVIGAQKRGKGASEVLDKLRMVEVYYSRGDFQRGAGGVAGPTKHDITFRVDLTVSKGAGATAEELAVIQDPAATAAAVAAAMASLKASDAAADDSLDELYEHVYQVLMDSRNQDFGLKKGIVASRWVSGLAKDEPIERGNYTLITGQMSLTLATSEAVLGYDPIEAGNIIETTLQLDTDEPGKAGTITGE